MGSFCTTDIRSIYKLWCNFANSCLHHGGGLWLFLWCKTGGAFVCAWSVVVLGRFRKRLFGVLARRRKMSQKGKWRSAVFLLFTVFFEENQPAITGVFAG